MAGLPGAAGCSTQLGSGTQRGRGFAGQDGSGPLSRRPCSPNSIVPASLVPVREDWPGVNPTGMSRQADQVTRLRVSRTVTVQTAAVAATVPAAEACRVLDVL